LFGYPFDLLAREGTLLGSGIAIIGEAPGVRKWFVGCMDRTSLSVFAVVIDQAMTGQLVEVGGELGGGLIPVASPDEVGPDHAYPVYP